MKKTNGFTLVELSIVLVIIGLLIGGILVAQSMIGTAKIQGMVRQLQQYDVAVSNFQTKYDQLPGDSNLFPNNNSNHDGLILGGESFYAWYHLSLGVGLKNAKNNDYSPIDPATDGSPTEDSCPKFNINQDITIQPCLYIANWYVYSPTDQWYMYHSKDYYNLSGHSPLRTADTLSLDKKIDDGIPITGKIFANGGCSTPYVYDLTNTGYVCAPFIALGVTNDFRSN